MEPAVRMADFGSAGQGQQATRDIAAGSVVLEVSLADDCWTAANAAAAPELPEAVRDVAKQGLIPESDLIALHLLAASSGSGGSRAEHAKQMLQATQYDLPMLWSNAELELLEGSTHRKFIDGIQKDLDGSWQKLEEVLGLLGPDAAGMLEQHSVTQARYMVARAAVQSRSTVLEVLDASSGESKSALCLPGGGADLFNHSPDVPVGGSFRLTAEGKLQVVSLLAAKEGEQVFISYGDALSTPQLLYSYGFAYPASLEPGGGGMGLPLPGDTVTLVHEVPSEMAGKLEAAREGMAMEAVASLGDEEHVAWVFDVREEDDSVAIEFRLRPGGGELPRCWLVHARVMALEEPQLEALQAEGGEELMAAVISGRPLSAASEESALAEIEMRLLGRLDAYGSSTSAMLERLSRGEDGGTSSRRVALALNLIMVEKAILDKALEGIEALRATGSGGEYVF